MLRDFYCTACDFRHVDREVDRGVVAFRERCPSCGTVRRFEAVCNGGVGRRYRLNDWPDDPEFYRGQVQVIGADARDSDGEPVREYTSGTREHGAPMHDRPQYHNGTDERETRRDMIKHATRRKRGKLPLVLDMGRN